MKEKIKEILLWIGLLVSAISLFGLPILVGSIFLGKAELKSYIEFILLIVSFAIPMFFIVMFHGKLYPLARLKRLTKQTTKGEDFVMYGEHYENEPRYRFKGERNGDKKMKEKIRKIYGK